MKKTSFLLFLMIIALSVNTYGQTKPKIHGSGNVVKQSREAGYFNAVKVSTAIDLILTQGNSESITVEADDNLHEHIITEIKNNTLRIYTEANIQEAREMNVYVTMKDIEKISATSAGDVVGESVINSDELYLSTSSAGDIDLEVNARKLTCNISSAGDMTLPGTTDELEAHLSSAGDLNAYDLTSRTARISASSSGEISVGTTTA